MAMAYYRWFPGDYARDTRHLSLLQHGVYRLLIDLYMDTGGPLRNDLPYLYRWLHAESVEEKNGVEYVLGELFELRDNRWNHKRCDAELQWRAGKSAGAKKAIVKRWENERNTDVLRTNYECNTNQNQNQIKPKPLVQIDPDLASIQASITEPKPAKPKNPKPFVQTAFARWWDAYPKHKAKAAAIKAWTRINPTPELVDTMVAAVEAAKRTEQWRKDQGQYIPMPATWLNGQRWEDETAPLRSIERRVAI